MRFQNPSREAIRALLEKSRTIAVIGLSDDPGRPSYGVTQSMRGFGYRIVPVNPMLDEWEGIPAHSDLDAAVAALEPGERIDIVNVFRRPARVGAVVDDCLRLGLPALWLQVGVVNEDAAARAAAAGMTVVMDRCIWVDRRAMTGP
ncbi:MAG TPA: CoA-binding protein [Steroidobacteraceae bacterium]|nr:CoA-binding protein [Steroidobacteraceae bacterium]